MKIKTKEKTPYPVVSVRGFDWAAYDGEKYKPDQIKDTIKLVDAWVCGYLIFEDEDRIVLAREFYGEGFDQFEGIICISKNTIKERVQYG